MIPRLGLVVSFAPLEVGAETAPEVLRRASDVLGVLPVELVAADGPVSDLKTGRAAAEKLHAAGVDAICWLACTWSFDTVAVDLLSRCPVPVVAWGTPGLHTGSLCSSQQLVSVLTELDHPRQFVYGSIEDAAAQDQVLSFARAAAVVGRLRTGRLGLLGHRTEGMTEVTAQEYDIRNTFGPILLCRGTQEFLQRREQTDPAAARTLWQDLKSRVGECRVDDETGERSMRAYAALRQWIEADSLVGVALGCYPDLMGEVCLAAGLLAEDGFLTACEGDVNTLIATYYVHNLAGGPTHNTDLLAVDRDENSLLLSHCGNSALCLAEDRSQIVLDSVRLMNRGVVAHYPGKPGCVTFANLCGRAGTFRMTYGCGEAVAPGMDFPGIPVQIQLPVPLADFLERTADFGTGHHWIVAYGDVTNELRTAAGLLGVRHLAF